MRSNSNKTNTIDTWVKKGSFHDEQGYQFLNRIAEYTHTTPNAAIKKVELLGYRDGDIAVLVGFDRAQYMKMMAMLESSGYPKHQASYEYNACYRITIPNTDFLNTFLQTLAKADEEINQIAHAIMTDVRPYSKEEQSISGWIKEGVFSEVQFHGDSPLNRREDYVSCVQGSKIEQLALLGYNDESIQMRIEMDLVNVEEVVKALTAYGCLKPKDHCSYDTQFISIHSLDELKKTLHALNSVEPSVANISDRIAESYISASISAIKTSRLGLFKNGNNISLTDYMMPSQKIDKEELDEWLMPDIYKWKNAETKTAEPQYNILGERINQTVSQDEKVNSPLETERIRSLLQKMNIQLDHQKNNEDETPKNSYSLK